MGSIIMVATECTCLAFMLIIMAAHIVLPRSGRLGKDVFFFCILSLILGLAFDMVSWLCECVPAPKWLQYSSNTLCLISSGFINSFFAYYIIGLIREEKPVSWYFARIISIVNICGTIAIAVGAFCGKLYDIVPSPDNPGVMYYLAGSFIYDIPNYLAGISLLVLFAIVLLNAEALGRKKVIVFSIYFLAPMFASALEIISEDLQFSLSC